MERIIDTTWRVLPTLSSYYRFNIKDDGETAYNALRGPEYLRALRHAALDAGVTILDQSPVLELLLHDDGSVAGANGVRRQEHRAYTARAGAVILATGGAGFLGGLLGSSTNTGDGHLMALEVGAELSGMEFSNEYSISPRLELDPHADLLVRALLRRRRQRARRAAHQLRAGARAGRRPRVRLAE